jgi:hypothetical protein
LLQSKGARQFFFVSQNSMDGNPDDASGWKNKFKKAVAINKQLVPLKMTMLLYYGGNFFNQI